MATERTVKVVLTADVQGFAARMAQAQKASKQLTDNFKQEATTVGLGLTAIGVAAGGAVGVAVKKFADFDQAISYVQAATHETASNMNLLRDAALDAGARTVFSATESANAIEELAKAGVSTADILNGGLNGALDLAAAGGLGVADAASIAATQLEQFKLSGSDMSHVADLLAAGAGKAQGDVTDLAQAMKYVGPVASGMGVSIEETTGTLAAFASQGILADQAGTTLRGVLASLTSPSQQAKGELDKLGVTLYDSNGKFLGLANMAGQLTKAYEGMTDAQKDASLGIIFGNQQITGARVLLDQGRQGIEKWTKAVDDQGYAAETARIRLDNLSGDVEQLGGAFDTVFIKAGEGANGPLRALVQVATEAVTAFGELPDPVQQTILLLTAAAAAASLAGGAFLLGVPKIVEFSTALNVLATSKIPGVAAAAETLIATTGRAGSALAATAKFLTGPWGVALAAGAVGVKVLSDALSNAQASSEEMKNALASSPDADNIIRLATQGLDLKWGRDATALLKDLDSSLDHSADVWRNYYKGIGDFDNAAFLDATKKIGQNLSDLAKQDLPTAQRAFSELASKTDGSQKQLWRLLAVMPDYKQALVDQATQMGINVTTSNEQANQHRLVELAMGAGTQATAKNTRALAELSGQAVDADGSISDLSDAINNFGKGALDVSGATVAFQQAVSDASEAVEKNGATLDLSTQAGRDNQSALDDIAKSALGVASAQATAGESTETLMGTVQQGRDAFIAAATQMGLTSQQAQALADKYGLIPANVTTAIGVSGTDTALAQAQAVIDRLNGIQRNIDIAVKLHGAENLATTGGLRIANANGGFYSYASGGFGSGIYAGRAGALYKFAEPETRWEAFISGKPGQEARNRQVALTALDRLGGAPAYVPASSQYASAPTVSVNVPPIYVQNPFTGEYLLAKVETVASGVVQQAGDAQAREARRGFRGL